MSCISLGSKIQEGVLLRWFYSSCRYWTEKSVLFFRKIWIRYILAFQKANWENQTVWLNETLHLGQEIQGIGEELGRICTCSDPYNLLSLPLRHKLHSTNKNKVKSIFFIISVLTSVLYHYPYTRLPNQTKLIIQPIETQSAIFS